jgi:molecular chaperone GrpE
MKEEKMEGASAPNVNDTEPTVENQPGQQQETTDEGGFSEKNAEMEAGDQESEVEKLTREIGELKDKHLRLYSEFENFRRRTAKERLDLIGTANADLITALLPVLDDFERAMEASEKADSGTEHEGINLIYQKLFKELSNKGLKPMENLEGEIFDAEVHEAISQIPAPKKKLKNHIVHVVEKGYYLNDKVLRYAKVVIGT